MVQCWSEIAARGTGKRTSVATSARTYIAMGEMVVRAREPHPLR
ncbi:hypothetical protein [Dictyobacter arantiisoli]|nr:hypothetical protein [Dictyobacter arantiisoli]